MANVLELIRKFGQPELEFRVRVSNISSTKYVVYPTIAENPILYSDFASRVAPAVTWTGGGLIDLAGTPRTITFTPTITGSLAAGLKLKVYESNDGSTYSLLSSQNYDAGDLTVTTSARYVLATVEDETNGLVVYSTNDEAKNYEPLDVRFTYAEIHDTATDPTEDTLRFSVPIFRDKTTNKLVIDVDYRGINTFSELNETVSSTDDALIFYRGDLSEDFGVIGRTLRYTLSSDWSVRNYLFPFQSVKTLTGHALTRSFDLYTMTEYLVLLGKLRNIDDIYSDAFDAVFSEFKNLTKDSATNLHFSLYRSDGVPLTDLVDIAANAYMAARFLASGEKELIDFVLVDNGSANSLVDLLSSLRNSDGFIPDSYSASTGYETNYRAFTEGLIYFVQGTVVEWFNNYAPANFNKEDTFNSLLDFVDTVAHEVYASKEELLGSSVTPRVQDYVALLAVFLSVPFNSTEDYTDHINEIKNKLSTYIVSHSGTGCSSDPLSPDYNPDWCSSDTIVGLTETLSENTVDSRWTLFLKAVDFDYFYNNTDIDALYTEDGILLVPYGVVASEKYIVPSAYSTFLDINLRLAGEFLKSGTYTVKVLNDVPNDISVTVMSTNDGAVVSASLSYASGIVVYAVGETTNNTYDVQAVETPQTEHEVLLRVPNVPELVRIYVIPIRPYNLV